MRTLVRNRKEAIIERNLSTPDGGAEDGGLIDGPDGAQQANLNTAPVTGEWTTNVRHPLCCHLMKARQVSKTASVLDCREPADFYKMFM
ncbi:hypothetical protein KIN20_009108 [Parelaphostrongylus tenuis]|uniref:Uncharacterized protein n=1 Tax=Parelaphostrongylus tenuis TaxID=148309 RepID=A0AAD5QN51_PARTN|nr:hypothetical protein KIN20_009108 [Parelaphostrongylus tenuis]